MNLNEVLTSMLYSQDTDTFNANIDAMRRKASKGLLEFSEEELNKAINEVLDKESLYEELEKELDEAVSKF